MSLTETNVQSSAHSRGGNRKGGRGRQGGNSNARGAANRGKQTTQKSEALKKQDATKEKVDEVIDVPNVDDDDAAICWICAEPVKYYSISECNHRTCHVCALRLRALYKKTDCTFCKEPQPTVIFTVSSDALFSSFTQETMSLKDEKLSIYFETLEMMEETLILLRFNCPDPDCDYIGKGWGDLKLHARATHGKLMCDLCIRLKKVFAHEHTLYPPNTLPFHLPSMHHRQHNKNAAKEQIEGGVHPLCEFCRECFFGDDEHYAHMRERHEECFICKRNDVRFQYFQNYESLENHFNHAHHPCRHSECLAQKFVVFNTPLDLQAHMVEEHGRDMSSRDKKDARRIQAEFEFEEVGMSGGRHGRRDRGHREHLREPPPQPPPPAAPSAPPRPPGPDRRRGFGASLTTDVANPTSNLTSNNNNEQGRPSTPFREDVDPATAERHAMFISRLQSLAANPAHAVPAIKAAIRGYRASETTAQDFISTVWNVMDQNLEHAASIVNSIVDLLDQEDKKTDLLAAWKGFVVEQRRQFPELIPSAVGSGYAAITSGRVLNAKHSTATRSSQRSSRQVWDRVAQAAGSSTPLRVATPERFPVLKSSAAGSSHIPGHRQPQRSTAWSASAADSYRPAPTAPASNQSITVIPDPRGSRPGSGTSTPNPPPPKLSNASFPGLPTSTSTRAKPAMSGNVSLKNILGNSAPPPTTAWQAGFPSQTNENAEEVSSSAPAAGKGKKGKGKQKQTLFTLGSFPA